MFNWLKELCLCHYVMLWNVNRKMEIPHHLIFLMKNLLFTAGVSNPQAMACSKLGCSKPGCMSGGQAYGWSSTHTSSEPFSLCAKLHSHEQWALQLECKTPLAWCGPSVSVWNSTHTSGGRLNGGRLCLRANLHSCEQRPLTLEAPFAWMEGMHTCHLHQ